jgi:hypothetical protein
MSASSVTDLASGRTINNMSNASLAPQQRPG